MMRSTINDMLKGRVREYHGRTVRVEAAWPRDGIGVWCLIRYLDDPPDGDGPVRHTTERDIPWSKLADCPVNDQTAEFLNETASWEPELAGAHN